MRTINRCYPSVTLVGLLCLLVLGGLVYSANHAPAAAQRPARAPFDFDRYTGNKPFKLNMLECKGNTAPIALCYYSGSGPTAPCIMDGRGIANCTCYEIPAGQTYYVDINAILNLDVYQKTVATCGKAGERCLPTGTQQAPVCEAINHHTLIPGADLISTFSLYLEKTMPIGST